MARSTFRQAARLTALGVFVLSAALLNGCGASRGPQISLVTAPAPPAVAVRDLSPRELDSFDRLDEEHKRQVLQVYVSGAPHDAPSVLGSTARRGSELLFTPRYPFQPGVDYRAELHAPMLAEGQAVVVSQFSAPAPPSQAVTRVEAIYPTSDDLPENLLRFYIHFSGPMTLGEVYKRVRLVDENRQTVPKPFLELEEELWNPQMTRCTLLFDPGRIKHGLVSQMELGPAMTAGRKYTLVIDKEWPDAQGRPLLQPAAKTFHTTPALRDRPDPAQWQITPPHADSSEPLVVRFDRPMDYALLQRVILVKDSRDWTVAGAVAISEHERSWTYRPQFPWPAGRYHLAVQTILEDPAGNSVRKEFEVDLSAPAPADAPAVIEIQFEVR